MKGVMLYVYIIHYIYFVFIVKYGNVTTYMLSMVDTKKKGIHNTRNKKFNQNKSQTWEICSNTFFFYIYSKNVKH